MTDNAIPLRGRPPVPLTDAERKERHRAAVARSKAKYKNITVDADMAEALNHACDQLERKFGFRPTASQTLRHLLKQLETE